MTAQELAERAGISRALLYRIERGDLRSSIGAVFEAAAVAGVPLFEPERDTLAARVHDAEERLALLPKAVRRRRAAVPVSDDF
jgi:transcriptional regulator with XRE-family HTH domain